MHAMGTIQLIVMAAVVLVLFGKGKVASLMGAVGTVRSAVKQAVSVADDGQTFLGTPRNAQCPCGSGKKYKLCHGKNEVA